MLDIFNGKYPNQHLNNQIRFCQNLKRIRSKTGKSHWKAEAALLCMSSGAMQFVIKTWMTFLSFASTVQTPKNSNQGSHCHDRFLDCLLCWVPCAGGLKFISNGDKHFVGFCSRLRAVGGHRSEHYRWFQNSGIHAALQRRCIILRRSIVGWWGHTVLNGWTKKDLPISGHFGC